MISGFNEKTEKFSHRETFSGAFSFCETNYLSCFLIFLPYFPGNLPFISINYINFLLIFEITYRKSLPNFSINFTSIFHFLTMYLFLYKDVPKKATIFFNYLLKLFNRCGKMFLMQNTFWFLFPVPAGNRREGTGTVLKVSHDETFLSREWVFHSLLSFFIFSKKEEYICLQLKIVPSLVPP